MASRFILIFVVTNGLIFATLGALDVHVLSRAVRTIEMGWVRTGLEYQVFCTLAILGLAVAVRRRISTWFYWSSVFLALDTALFGSSPYCLALPHLCLWASVIPADGASFLAGWALVLVDVIRLERKGVGHEQDCIAVPSGL